MVKIVDLMLQEVHIAAEEQGLQLIVTDAAKERLAELGYNPAFGARPLRRVIEEQVEDGIADLLLEGEEIQEILVDTEADGITVSEHQN